MGTNSIKILLLILGLVNLAFSKVESHNFDDIKNITDKGTKTFQINFSSQGNYKDYIKISLKPKKDQMNPRILISDKNSDCTGNRLYLGVQTYAPIYIFLKKSQIYTEIIYICVEVEDDPDSRGYTIIFDNEDSAKIPFNGQASYYISDKNTENMKFTFIKPENEAISSDSKVTVWFQGNYIEKPSLPSFTEEIFDSAYVYHGSYSEDLELEIKSKTGDYVTIGSTIISDKTADELKENANEIIVASEEEVCLPLVFKSSHISHITGRIFTRKADICFKDESGEKLDKEYDIEPISNGILDVINSIGLADEKFANQKGFFCLKSSIRNKPLVFAIQMTSNKYLNMAHPPLYPGEFRRDFLMKHEIVEAEKISYKKVMAMVSNGPKKFFYLYTPYKVPLKSEMLPKTKELTTIEFNKNLTAVANDAFIIQKYKLKFSNSLNKNENTIYFKIKISHIKGDESPIIYSSLTDEDCKNNRLQLSKDGVEFNEMWIKKEQLGNQNYIYFVIECLDENNCAYNIEFGEDEQISLDSVIYYSYYVNNDNTDMVFRYKNEADSLGKYLTMYATGSNNVNLNLKDCEVVSCSQFNFTEGAAITTVISFADYYYLTVHAVEGSYITVGAKIVDKEGKSSANVLKPEIGPLSGFLRKDLLEKECYKLPDEFDVYFIEGTLYDSIANITYLYDEINYIPEDTEVHKAGFFYSIYDSRDKKKSYACISFLNLAEYPLEGLSYSIQIQSKSKFKNNYVPQSTGFIYPRIIPTSKLVYFNNLSPKVLSDRIVYNMITLEGYPKMYLYECKTYPSCQLNYDDNLESTENVERVAEINRMSTLSLLYKEASPIDAEQTVLMVKCIKANTTENYGLCKFMTSIFGEKEQVKLIEEQPFSQYILPGDKDTFLIDFSSENLKEFKIHIDLLVVSGDVSFELKNADDPNKKIDLHNYNLGNKIFYSITVNQTTDLNTELKRISIAISAKVNSYYIMEYKIVKHPVDEELNYIFSNINYLIPLFIKKDENIKEVNINSVKIIAPQAFLATFYSLNCKIDVYKFGSEGKQQLPFFGNYGQDYHSINKENPFNYKSEYSIQINKKELAPYNNINICMIYVSGLEIYPNYSGIRKEILVSEGIPQRIIFQNDLTKVRYLYPHSNPEKNITVSINMIVQGKFRVKIFFREQSYNQEEVYSQSTIIFIKREWIHEGCRENELCTITVEIEKIADFLGREPILEIVIKQVLNEPYYLPKGILRNDFISGEAYLFLYTDVDKGDGYITINFYRGSGYIYAKVVKINQEKADDNAEWRKYRFPRSKEESLYYDFYNKKILFNQYNTKNCEEGCYILISIKTSVIGKEVLDNEFQYFSILAEYSPKYYELKLQIQRKINIDPEEYVIGSLYEADDFLYKKGVYNYYSIVCPYDAPGVEIDWQSDTAQLLINIGEILPEKQSPDFNYTGGRDTNIFLSKKDILAAYNGGTIVENQNLTNIEIILRIYTKYYDSINSTVYFFRVHFSELDLNIYKINSDHKAICKPEILQDNKYRCLFMVIYEQFQYFNDLVIYAKSQSSSAIINMYASYLDNEIYNSYDVQKLKDNIPDDDNSIFSTKKEKTNFIFLSYGDFHKNAYISVISDNEATIELYTSMKTFEDKLSPNPSSPQVYAIDKFKDDLSLDFITTKSIGINIISLYGEANIYLEKDPNTIYYLRGRDDGLELMLPQSQDSNSLLVIKRIKSEREGDNLYPGFIFLIEFNKRTTKLNFDEIKSDEVSEISYKDGDFPVYYYSKLFDTEKDITIFFYLHDLVYSDSSNFNRKMTTDELSIKGAILEEKELFQIQKDGKMPDMKVIGKYDPSIQAGNIIISQKDLKSNTLSKPTLYLGIEKTDKIKDIEYNGVRGEIGFSFINGNSPLTQKLYQFGKIKDNNEIHSYKLRADNNTNYMRIQFSANSKYVSFSVSDKPNEKKNISSAYMDKKTDRGIFFLTFQKPDKLDYLYINIYLKENSKDDKLNNYVFKYINSETKEGFYEYKILNDKPNIEINAKQNNKIDVTFNPIVYEKKEGINISIIYGIKLVTNSDKIEEEYTNTIAITESNATAVQYKSMLDYNKITKELDNIPDDINYIQVIAQIKQGSIIEYVDYQAFIYSKDYHPSTPEKSNNNTGLYIGLGIGGVFLVIAIILAVFLFLYCRKNKDLMDQVNKISFTQSGAKEKDDTNLLVENVNEIN